MQSQATVTTADLAKDCRTLEDIRELLKNVFKDTVRAILDGEMEQHLCYEKHNIEGNNTGNSRNGYSKKKIKTAYGPTEVDVPRDRNGEFEPKVVKKYQTTASHHRTPSRRTITGRCPSLSIAGTLLSRTVSG